MPRELTNSTIEDPDISMVPLRFRQPRVPDAKFIWELVRESEILDLNSCYAYALVCKDFCDTSVVVELNSEIIGFVAGYEPPKRKRSLFVWQVCVKHSARRLGLAHRMLREILQRQENSLLKYIEATITPSNLPSRKMFESFAETHRCEHEYQEWFESGDFSGVQHEAEQLIRIGPIELS